MNNIFPSFCFEQQKNSESYEGVSNIISRLKEEEQPLYLTFLTSARTEVVRESLIKKKVNCTYNIFKIFLSYEPMDFMHKYRCYSSPLIRDVTKGSRLEFVEVCRFFSLFKYGFQIRLSETYKNVISSTYYFSFCS